MEFFNYKLTLNNKITFLPLTEEQAYVLSRMGVQVEKQEDL